MKKIPLILLCFIVISCNSDNSSLYDENADDDGDGITNLLEDLNQDGNPDNDDTDGDGIPNYLDPDDDGDGILTSAEDSNGDGYIIIDDEDCDDIPDYLDADRFQALNGVWRLINATSGYTYNGAGGHKRSHYWIKQDTLRYLNVNGVSSYADTLRFDEYIYKAKMTINFPSYEFNNTEFRGITNTFQSDTIYTKQFGEPCQYTSNSTQLINNTFGYFYINDNFFNDEIHYCAAGDFCVKQTQDTLSFYSFKLTGNYSGFNRKFVFVRE